LRGDELRAAMFPGSPSSFQTIFPARDWLARATQIVDQWESSCRQVQSMATCRPGWRDAIREARALVGGAPTNVVGADRSVALRDFVHLAGVQCGASEDVVVNTLGAPSKRTDRAKLHVLSFFDGKVTATLSNTTGSVEFISARKGAAAALRERGIADEKLAW